MSRVRLKHSGNESSQRLDDLENSILNGRYKFNRDNDGNIIYDRNGHIDITKVISEAKTPEELRQALSLYEITEKEAIANNTSPSMRLNKATDPDYENAVALAGLLSSQALTQIARLGKHGVPAGNRQQKIDFAGDYLWKNSYGYDPVTGVPLIRGNTDAGHLLSNSRGGIEVRPEDSWVNQVLQDTEGEERLNAINKARSKLNTYESSLNPKVVEDPDIRRLVPEGLMSTLQKKARKLGFSDSPIIANASGGSTQNIVQNVTGNVGSVG